MFAFVGIPSPAVPPLGNVPDYLVDAFICAAISFVVSAAMFNIFAHKYRYKVDANQVYHYIYGNPMKSLDRLPERNHKIPQLAK